MPKRVSLKRPFLAIAAAVLLALALSAPVVACPTGLTLIPITDVVPRNAYSIEFQSDGSVTDRRTDTYLVNTEVGLGDRAEIGVDFDRSAGAEARSFWNGKVLLALNEPRRQSLALGVYGVAHGLEAIPYLVAGTPLGKARAHIGIARIDGRAEALLGVDHALNAQWTLMADTTTGRDNCSSAGFNYAVNNRFSVMTGAVLPNNGDDPQFTVHFVITGPLRRPL